MKEQGSHTVQFLGINRNKSANVSPDGEMEELINLRSKNGSLEVVGDFPLAENARRADGTPIDFSVYEYVYLHKTSNYEHWIVVRGTETGKQFIFLDGEDDYSEVLIFEKAGNDLEYNVLGIYNYLVLYFEDRNESFLWENGGYKRQSWQDLDFSLKMNLSYEVNGKANAYEYKEEKEYFAEDGRDPSDRYTLQKIETPEGWLDWVLKESPAAISDIASQADKNGDLWGSCMWMYAVKNKAGAYILFSPVMYLTTVWNRIRFGWDEKIYRWDKNQDHARVTRRLFEGKNDMGVALFSNEWMYREGNVSADLTDYFSILFSQIAFSMSVDFKTDADLSLFKEDVSSIDIFLSPPVRPFEMDSQKVRSEFFVEEKSSYSGENSPKRHYVDAVNAIVKTSINTFNELRGSPMYLAKSIPLSELSQQTTIPLSISAGGDFDFINLPNKQKAPDIQTSYHSFVRDCYVYNGKVHSWNMTDSIKLPHVKFYHFQGGFNIVGNKTIACDIEYAPKFLDNYTDHWGGTLLFKTTLTPFDYIFTHLVSSLYYTPLEPVDGFIVAMVDSKKIVYKDSDATFINEKLIGIPPYISYIDPRCKSIELVMRQGGTWYSHKGDILLKESTSYSVSESFGNDLEARKFDKSAWIAPDFSINPTDFIEDISKNIMRVTDGTSPLISSFNREFSIGSGAILGLYTNTKAISTGQFGEYPLIALCSDGRWALGIGADEVDYATVRPMSRDVYLKDVDSEIEPMSHLDDGVAFLTKAGLLIGSGSELVSISDTMEGDLFRFVEQGISHVDILKQAINHPKLVQLNSALSRVEFNDYASGANIGFIYGDNKEIVIANPQYDYSYVFSLDSGSFFKIDLRIEKMINNYPQLLGMVDGKMFDLSSEQKTEGKQAFFLTKPVKLGGINFKEAYRAVMRSFIRPCTNKYCGFYVLGSEDGQLWRFLGGTEFDGRVDLIESQKDFVDIGCLIERVDVRYLRFAFAGEVKSGTKLDFVEVAARRKRDRS
jgi:hypothetical protein